MTNKQKFAAEASPQVTGLMAYSGFGRAEHFHRAMGLPVKRGWPDDLSVSEREIRAKLLFEEFQETLHAMGFQLEVTQVDADDTGNWVIQNLGQPNEERIPQRGYQFCVGGHWDALLKFGVAHIEGSQYDPIETADGLAALKVIANGTAIAFGIPMPEVDWEVFCSNMSKLDDSWNPIINQCKYYGGDKQPALVAYGERAVAHDMQLCKNRERTNNCEDPAHLIDPNQPVGKLLKPANYIPANIEGLYFRTHEGDTK